MDLATMIISAANSLVVVVWQFLWSLAAFVGLWYCGSVLGKMQRASISPGQNNVSFFSLMPVMIIGAALWNLPVSINTVWNSYGSSTATFGAISYSGAEDFGKFKDAINAVLTLASMAGGFFFFKGLLLMKKACMEGQSSHGADDTVWRAMTHMVFGCGLVQIPDLIEAARVTFSLNW